MRYDAKTGKVKDRLPGKLGPAVDLLYEVDVARKNLNKVVEGLKASEGKLKNELLAKFKKSELNGAKGSRGQVELKAKDVPTMKDLQKFYKHLKKTGEFELLRRQLNPEAVRERWEAGKVVPGVDKFHVVSVSVTARKAGAKKIKGG